MGVGNVRAMVRQVVMDVDRSECVDARNSFVGQVGGVMANALAQAPELIGVRGVPGVFVGRMFA